VTPLLLTERDAVALLAAPGAAAETIDAMERAFVLQAQGRIDLRTRVVVDHPPGSVGERAGRSLRLLPCVCPELGGAAARIYTTRKEDDAARPAPAELLLLFDAETMGLRAVVEDYSLHAHRTGAPTGVAARALARPGSEVVAVLGTGRQARGQLAAIAAVLPVREVRAFGRDAERLGRFCRDMEALLGVRVEPAPSAREAVRGADVVLCATGTTEPVLHGEWLEPGQHVSTIAPGELDEAGALRVRAFPCSAHEVLHGVPRWTPFAELAAAGRVALEAEACAVVAGLSPGRGDDDEITAFLSTGMAYWDLVVAAWADAKARELGLGRPLGVDGPPTSWFVAAPAPPTDERAAPA
jgi:ornithine cyclodeaminase/alanine dehydrogenase-like protein (mu-crystallin family)